MKITQEIAEIIGLLCAEGSYHNYISNYWEYYPTRRKSYYKNKKIKYIQFANYDKNLLIHFRNLIKEVYNYNPSLSWDRVRICKRKVIYNLLKYTPYGHLKWKVPKEIINGSKIIKTRFIRGYFDGDGTAIGKIGFFSTNEKSLKKVVKILTSLSIENTFNGPVIRKNRKPYYHIYIRKKHHKRFMELIRPISKISLEKVL